MGHHLTERRQAIINALEKAGELSVADICKMFNISEVTVRKDLQALDEQNRIMRTRGGAMAIHLVPELSFDVRQQQHADQKARIGQAAAQMVRPGDSIALDASTTALSIIPFLKQIPELTVITNSLKAGMSLLRFPQVHVMLPGGSMRRDSISLVGQNEGEFFNGLNVRLGFFGARGFTLEQGFTDVNMEEGRTKRKMLGLCKQVIILIDGSKWGQMAVVTFAGLEKVHTIITDSSAPPELVEAVRRQGTQVMVV